MPSQPSPFAITGERDIKVFLASQSPRRKALLESAGITPIVIPQNPAVDAEAIETPLPGEAALPYVQRVAALKRVLSREYLTQLKWNHTVAPHDLILAADTTVALDGRILGKPADAREAAAMLRALSGKTHHVHTAVSIASIDGRASNTRVVSAQVRFAQLSDAWIDAYIASKEPMDKAGAYGIQGRAGAMIPEVIGSYTAIVGLPLYETLQMIHATSKDAQHAIR